MRRLFWRIFALFWASSVVLIVAIAWITSSNFENEKIPGLGITRLESVLNEHLRKASHTLRDGGVAGLRSMLGLTSVQYKQGTTALAVVDSTLS